VTQTKRPPANPGRFNPTRLALFDELSGLQADNGNVLGARLDRIVDQFSEGIGRIPVPAIPHCANGKLRRQNFTIQLLKVSSCVHAKRPPNS